MRARLDGAGWPQRAEDKLSPIVTSCSAGHRSFNAYTCMLIPPPAFSPYAAAYPLAVNRIAASAYFADAVLASYMHASAASQHAIFSPPSSWCYFNDCNYVQDGVCDDGGPSSGGSV